MESDTRLVGWRIVFLSAGAFVGTGDTARIGRNGRSIGGGGAGLWASLVDAAAASAPRLLVIAPIFFGQAVLSAAAYGHFKGRRLSIGECILAALRRFPSVLVVGVAICLLLFLARYIIAKIGLMLPPYGDGILLVALIVPFFVLGLSAAIAIPVLMQENLGLVASISRSRTLTKRHRWPIFGMMLTIIIGVLLGTRVTSEVLTPAEAYPAIALVVWTLIATVLTAAYVELRRVKEGPGADELAEIFS